MSEQQCVRGHVVPAGFRFCGICDGAIAGRGGGVPVFAGTAQTAASELSRISAPPRFAAAPTGSWSAPADLRPLPVAVPHDPDGAHLLRHLGVSLLVGAACYVLVGFVWYARILDRTGGRKRDVLTAPVPIVGVFVQLRAIWRYTARDVYWAPRRDRRSAVLAAPFRRWAIAGGYLALPAMVALGIAAGSLVGGRSGWTDADRAEVVRSYVQYGIDRATAECMVDQVILRVPDADGDYPQAFIDQAVDEALVVCTG